MKFRDLFLPKIARSDPEARIDAVRSETNVALLENVLEKDSSDDVRHAARERLNELRPEKVTI